jgi:8-oxo-dGDP phosphatase
VTVQPRDYPESWPVEGSEERFRGAIVGVYTDQVRMPGLNGTETVARERVTHPGSVAIAAVDTQDRILLLRQYRHAVRHQLWEIPAGLRDSDGEAPLDTARRELLEEAGYRARRWHTLTDTYTTPGVSNERVRIYLAREPEEVPRGEIDFDRIHEEADMPVRWVPLEEAVAAVLDGGVRNSLGQVGILAAAAARDRGFAGLRDAEAAED